jgi:hypothetical protein
MFDIIKPLTPVYFIDKYPSRIYFKLLATGRPRDKQPVTNDKRPAARGQAPVASDQKLVKNSIGLKISHMNFVTSLWDMTL